MLYCCDKSLRLDVDPSFISTLYKVRGSLAVKVINTEGESTNAEFRKMGGRNGRTWGLGASFGKRKAKGLICCSAQTSTDASLQLLDFWIAEEGSKRKVRCSVLGTRLSP